MKRTSFATCFLGLAGMAQAQTVVMDQIGPNDCSGVGGSAHASQDFEAAYDGYDVAVLDNFTMPAGTIISVEAVIGGWNGYTGPSPITGYNVEIYSDSANACSDLTGDVASVFVDAADAVINPDWTCNAALFQALVLLNVDIPLAAGDYWVAVWPENDFAAGGQCGIDTSTLGDGISGVQANPNGGFGMPGNCQDTAADMAYRIMGGGDPPDPCDEPMGSCPEDLDGDGYVTVNDLLALLANWGACGDGTFRPLGDIDGDCCVTVNDLLLLLAAWGNDCNVYGACCYDDGTCADGMTADACAAAGGDYEGDDTSCATTSCPVAGDGDECSNALAGQLGYTDISNESATPSSDPFNDAQCPDGVLGQMGPDIWVRLDVTVDGLLTASTCDLVNWDTDLVAYLGPCSDLTQIGCDGDGVGCGGYTSLMTGVPVSAGDEVYIRIGSWDGTSTGSGQLFMEIIQVLAGACCNLDGSCSDGNDLDCAASGGEFQGEGSVCADVTCPIPDPGACCIDAATCVDNMTEADCVDFGGYYQGDGTLCADITCDTSSPGDFCEDAIVASWDGLSSNTAYDTSGATESPWPLPDESQCSGTFLDWGGPDVFIAVTVPETGTMRVSTCEGGSFDTSVAVYTGGCDNPTQIACNGDGTGDTGCQAYYSAMDIVVSAGDEIIVRIAGWQGAMGPGVLHLTITPGSAEGACCVAGDCIGDLSEGDCTAAGGSWNYPESCATYTCPQPPAGCYNFYNDGMAENSVGLTAGGWVAWGVPMELPSCDLLTEVQVQFGPAANGNPVFIIITDDVNNDGDPSDGVVLSCTEATLEESDTDVWVTYQITPTDVSSAGGIHVSVAYESIAGDFPAHIDQTATVGNSWVGLGFTDGCDPWVGTNGIIDGYGLPGNWMIRSGSE